MLSTLWRVDDASTARLMQYFYAARVSGHVAALQQAQQALLRAGYGAYHWAPFLLHGD